MLCIKLSIIEAQNLKIVKQNRTWTRNFICL